MKTERPSSLRDVFGICWRYFLLLPVTLPLGLLLCLIALAFAIWPPLYVIILFIDGRWIVAPVILVSWGTAMYLLRHVYARIFEGSGGL